MNDIRLLITGKMGSGKSYAADYLVDEHGAMRWSRTELMKRLSHSIADHIGDPDEILERIFPNEEERSAVRDDLFAYHYQIEDGKPRRLYQDITEICQEHNPLCFEQELETRIRAVGSCDFSLIDDVRKLSAFEFFVDRGYATLRIDASEKVRRERMLSRDGYLPTEETFAHVSEVDLDGIEHDFTIRNDSQDLISFYSQLDRIVAQLRSSDRAVVQI